MSWDVFCAAYFMVGVAAFFVVSGLVFIEFMDDAYDPETIDYVLAGMLAVTIGFLGAMLWLPVIVGIGFTRKVLMPLYRAHDEQDEPDEPEGARR